MQKKPTAINYVKCTNVSNEYSDAMYAFKNNGDVNYSGPRFTLKEKQKLFLCGGLIFKHRL